MMSLPIDLVQEFAKSTFDPGNKIKETDCYGTAQNVDGNWFVQLDGSSELTPATPTTGVTSGDRVLVRIRNRKAVIIGNITNPIIITGILQANTGIVVKGYLTTNENRTTYNDQNNFGLTFSSGGMGSYGGNNKYWYVTSAGDLYANSAQIVGNITAKSGYLGTAESGFTIDSTGIYTGIKGIPGTGYVLLSAADVPRTLAGKAVTNARLAVGPNFGVTSDGTVYATGATISGTITAASGYIGNATNGFKIDASGFYSGANKTGNSTGYITLSNSDFTRTIGTTARSQLRLAIGSGFAVTSTGKLYANGADITGDIHATSLDLGSQKIPKENLDLPEGQDLSLYIYIDANGKIQLPKDNGTIGTPAAGSKGFRIAKDGVLTASNAVIYGTVYASAGSIGGLTLANNVLYSGSHSAWNTANTNGVYIGADHIALGPGGKFNVTDAGVLTATGATISGTITATSLTLGANVKVPYSSVSGTPNLNVYIAKDGTIGTVASGSTGFTVSSAGLLKASNAVIYGKLYSSEGTIGGLTLKSNALYSDGHSAWNTPSVNGVYVGTDYIALGPGGKFNVTNAGVLTASGATISGKLTSTEGSIAGFTLKNGALYTSTKSTFDSTVSGVYLGTNGIALGTGQFKVTSGGVLTASGATISGKLTSTEGSIAGFTLKNGALYTSTKSTFDSTVSGVYLGTNGIALGTGQFKVTSGGVLTASGATISGKLTSTEGSIAGFTLKNGALYTSTKSAFDSTVSGVYLGTNGIALGSGQFKVTSGGVLTASGATISGKLTSTEGSIGGFLIGNGKLYTTDHSAYDSNVDGVYIGTNSLSFGKGGLFYVTNKGIVYCNGGTVYFNFTASNNRISVASNLIFRINKSTDVGGIGYNISSVTSGTTTTYYGDLYLYTVGSSKNIYLKAYNQLNLQAAAINVGKTSDDANGYGNSAATSSVTISSSSYVSLNTDKLYVLKYLELRRNGSSPQLTLTSTTANTKFRLDGYTSVELGVGIPPSSQTAGAVPSPTVEFSMYASAAGPTYGFYYHVLNGTGSKWILYTTHSATSLICTPTLTVEGGLNISGGHVVAKPPSDKATEERALVSENNYGRIHCTISSDHMGLWVRGYKDHDGSTELYKTWLIYMKYNDSTYVYADKQIKANGTVLTGSSSDIRLKEKIEETEITSGLSLINKIHLHSFTWKHAYNNEYAGDRWKIGMIADEVEELDPTLTLGGGWEDEAHTIIDKKSINVFYLQGYIVKSIQELSGINEWYGSRIDRLENQIKTLTEELLKLKGAS